MSSSKPGFNRGLSLEDLVNHDDGSDANTDDKRKGSQTLNPIPAEEIKKRLSVDGSVSEGNGNSHSVPEGGSKNGRSKNGARGESGNDEETDTDDDVGGSGDIVFETGDFKFDYEKQEQEQDANSSKRADKPQTAQNIGKPVKLEDTTKTEEAVKPLEGHSAFPKKTKFKTDSDIKDIFQEKSTLQSKRNAIKKDLNVLNEIAATAKPSRYNLAPIWAQKWKPTVKALQSIDTKNLNIDASFTNVIPDDDLTKSVQDWVYATIVSIPPDLRQYIEMEMKFGIIVERSDTNRVCPPVSSQTVYTEMDAHLTPDVDERVFIEINKYIKGISELSEYTGKFNIIESHTKDSLYRVGASTQRPRFLRMSRDVKTGRVGQFIEKRHISQLLLFSPKDSYDVKISINLELPVPDNDPPEKYKDNTPVNTRTKQRISYIHNDSCTRMDITKVANHNQGVKQKHTEDTHEIELEVNTAALLSAFENITQNNKEYASILRTFLNNGTIIRRKLSALSFEIFEGQKKV
ncbi:LANO_0E03202g1_1 [Lachancea nothofagi CBS 11611]|uniref:mRNA-capping enzyme subunit beta n=1 Tax=Lachancea nothofagi CBS 11611 TaxID=1266666 RepID=A0A1G4JQT6_9SACH|nr:LANO_0E03202g1_1 [Lachancea nothofagi CBS 11611]